jgi:hypothetical protein
MVSLLQQPTISHEIRESFIFLPLDVTWPEGWRVAAELEFKTMPLIAMIRPRGSSLAESKVFVTYEGKVGESTLLSSMRVELNERSPDAQIVQEQDNDFDRAVRADEENRRREVEVVQAEVARRADEVDMQQRVEAEFASLPEPQGDEELATIRFQFPDSTSKTRKFARNGPVRFLFIFVRKYMWPRTFGLKSGFPQTRVEESEKLIGEVFREKQFIVYVEEDD